MKSRVILVFVFIAGLFILGLVRVLFLQVIPNKNLTKLKNNQYMSRISLLPHRGKILDRAGEELATSVTTYSLYADPLYIEYPKTLAKKLANILNIPRGEVLKKISQQDRRFVWIKRQIEPEVMKQIKALNEVGLAFAEEGKRSYPNLSVASQILGFVGIDGDGLEGLEKKYDAELKGEKLSILSRRDARGRPLVVSGQIFETSNDGATIEVTLDKEIQYELERQLEEVTLKQTAERAVGIVMDPNTGEIIAMASYPSYDPAEISKASAENRRNHNITDIFEPGSTFKIITAAAALKTGRIFPNTKYFCEDGKMKIGKRIIREAEGSHKYKWLSLAQIIELSSNIGSTKVAFDVGEDAFRKMILDFGFGEPTGVDFPGEASGMVKKSQWGEHLTANISFGHGVGATALQVANAYSTIANGGKRLQPFFVKRVVDHQGNIIQENLPKVVKEVLTPKEASTLLLMLSGATQEGATGTLARVDGYPVAGKTGTAQKVNTENGGYTQGAYVSSFAGIIPANQPQYVIYIAVDNPQKDYYGAQVAAPVFNKVASFALRKKGFLPVILSEKSIRKPKAVTKIEQQPAIPLIEGEEVMPALHGLTIKEVTQELKKLKNIEMPKTMYLGSGYATQQWPPAGWVVKDRTKVKVNFK